MKKLSGVALLSVMAVITMMFGVHIAYADDISMTTTVSSSLVATFNYASVSFGTLSAGTSNNVAPNQATGVYNVSVTTNADYQLDVNGTDWTGSTSNFGIGNLTMDSDSSAGSLAEGNSVVVTASPVTIDTAIDYTNAIHYHGFWLDIPSGQFAEAYSTTVTMTYSSV